MHDETLVLARKVVVALPWQRRAQHHGGDIRAKIRGLGVIMGAWLAALALSGAGSAQEGLPNRTVRVVNPYSAGSVADVFGRIVTQNMAAQWKASIILESKSGANGSLAAEDVARAAPDGYTWLLVTTFFTTSPSLNLVLRWDPARDFVPVGQICRAPNFGRARLRRSASDAVVRHSGAGGDAATDRQPHQPGAGNRDRKP
jgi:hypothetical protein